MVWLVGTIPFGCKPIMFAHLSFETRDLQPILVHVSGRRKNGFFCKVLRNSKMIIFKYYSTTDGHCQFILSIIHIGLKMLSKLMHNTVQIVKASDICDCCFMCVVYLPLWAAMYSSCLRRLDHLTVWDISWSQQW